MENKIESLRNSIKANQNLSEEFKCNLGTLTDTMVTVLPFYDYSNYEKILSTLDIKNDCTLDGYSSYNKDENMLSLNTNKAFEDRIDLQHLFLNNLLYMGLELENKALEGFFVGLTENISTLMNNDDSMKKLNILESLAMNIFSKIVDPETLINSYMTRNVIDIVVELESYGISNDDFTRLLEKFNKMSDTSIKENTAFTDAEVIMTNMFSKVVDTKLKSGDISFEDISDVYSDFSDMLILGSSELVSMYGHHDFSNITGFENVKDTLDSAVLNSEIIEDIQMIK